MSTKQEIYEFAIDLMMTSYASGGDREALLQAFAISEQRRARSLIDNLREARSDLRKGIPAELLSREVTLRAQLNQKADRQIRLASGKNNAAEAAAVAAELEKLTNDYEQVLAEIRIANKAYASLTEPVQLSLREIQAHILDADTVLVEYGLGTERSYVWIISKDRVEAHVLPPRAEVESLARKVHDLITARNRLIRFEHHDVRRARIAQADADYIVAATALSKMVLSPVVGRLNAKRLLIVADGALQYVPFAALPRPIHNETGAAREIDRKYQPLILTTEVVNLPSVSTLGVLRAEFGGRRSAPKTLAVFADPVFEKNDRRLMQQAAIKKIDDLKEEASSIEAESDLSRSTRDFRETEFTRLPFSRKEANTIVALAAKPTSTEFLDFDASRSNAIKSEIADYRILHFATHALLNNEHPQLSGIVLSLLNQNGHEQDGFLRMTDIYNMKLGADLVVLSGCRTALGKEIKGEGLVGLTRAFMYAGAPRVIASYWAVDDESTAELMRRFYQEMLVKKQPPASALRAAQIRMWQEKKVSPFYWAGFALQGDWK